MPKYVLTVAVLLCAFAGISQKSRNLNGKSRKDFFGGARDIGELSQHGLQVSFGPNLTLTRLHNPVQSGNDGIRPISYTIDPISRPGGFIEIGMVHYRMKKPAWLKKNIIHYIDWGIGFDYISGSQQTNISYLALSGTELSAASGMADFHNGYIYGRITAHRLLRITDNLHFDYGLGLNANYQVLSQSVHAPEYITAGERYQQPFIFQVHAQIGLNIRLSRGNYLVPGIWAPVLGAYEWASGRPTIAWFNSNYYPVNFQLKWLHNFKKRRGNGCNTGTDEDRKRNEEYMQNR